MGNCKGCSGSCSSTQTTSTNCSCKGNCTCKTPATSSMQSSSVTYTELPLGMPEDHTGLKKPSDAFKEGMRVYIPGIQVYGIIKEVRYRDCVIHMDGSPDTATRIFDCRFLIPEAEGEGYEKRVSSLLSPTPSDPFEK